MNSEFLQKPINLYLSADHECNYLSACLASSLFVDPASEMTADIYSGLVQQGFRRSGNYVYTPHCKKCHECIPVRLNVQEFTLSRSQKRCKNKNKQLIVKAKDSVYDEVQYQLYSDYVRLRHPGGGMDEPSDEKYLDFLTSQWSNTVFFEFQEAGKVIGVAATDIVMNGLSAVYTFFDSSPDYQKRSVGVYSIIWQAEEARRRGMKWLYLGYWINACNKMNYKDKYQPLEYFYNHRWHSVPPTAE